LTKIRKRDGRTEEFDAQFVSAGVAKAGATVREAVQVAKEVSLKVSKKSEISSDELSETVSESLRKINKTAAEEFVGYRDKQRKAKR
jgi:transcriptional regulator NrdR family protein